MARDKERTKAQAQATAATLPLIEALKLLGAVVERRATIPVLSCVRVSPGRVEATDLDNFVTVETGETRDAPGEGVQIVLRSLAAAVAETDGSIAFDRDSKGALVRVGSNPTVSVRTCPEEMPAAKEIGDKVAFELPARQFAADLDAVSPAMSSEETRYYLMGQFWHVGDGELRFVATDGHRLHRVSRPLPDGAAELKDSIIPRKAIKLLAAAIAAQPSVETVRVLAGRLLIGFEVGAVRILTRLIDGTFPDYRRVIPDRASAGMVLPAQELIRPATLAKKLLGKQSPAMAIAPRHGTVSAKSPEGTEIAARIDRKTIGEPCETIGFRHEYLLDSLVPFLGHSVTMAFADHASPTLIESAGRPELTVVLMPMRV